jgi:hypothetical protein
MSTQLQTEPVAPELQLRHWSLATRIAFRFCFVYFGLYCLLTQIFTSLVPLPNVDIPDPSTLWPMGQIVIWTASHILRITKPPIYTETGSGDRAFDWVLVFCLLIIAAVATLVWSILDRKRENCVTLYKWFRLYIRICLAGQMLGYGLAKAVPLQMPYPSLTRLLEPFGQLVSNGSSVGLHRLRPRL